MANAMTSSQYAEMHDLRRACGMSEDDLEQLWLDLAMPKNFHSVARVITILTIYATFKRMGYNQARQNECLEECVGEVKPVELLTADQIKMLHKRVKMIEGKLNNPAEAPYMVARMKIDTTQGYHDQKAALTDCDHYEQDTLKIMFSAGKATRISINGVVFEAVDFREWR